MLKMTSIVNIPFFIVPSSLSNVSVYQNGLSSVLVSWTSEDPTATGYNTYYIILYIIYYQQQDGEERFSLATATSATITGLIAGATYSFSVASTSGSTPIAAPHDVTIGILYYYIEGWL